MKIAFPSNSLDLISRSAEIESAFGSECFYLTCKVQFNRQAYEDGLLSDANIVIDKNCPVVIDDSKKSPLMDGVKKNFQTVSDYRQNCFARRNKTYLIASSALAVVGSEYILLKPSSNAKWSMPMVILGNLRRTGTSRLITQIAYYSRDKNAIFTFKEGNVDASERREYLDSLKKRLSFLKIRQNIGSVEFIPATFTTNEDIFCHSEWKSEVNWKLGARAEPQKIPYSKIFLDIDNRTILLHRDYFISNPNGEDRIFFSLDSRIQLCHYTKNEILREMPRFVDPYVLAIKR